VPAAGIVAGVMTNPHTIAGVLRWMITCPREALVSHWNYKSAVLSSVSRGAIFFSANLVAGLDAAVAALLIELCLRGSLAGFYGAATQAFRAVTPPSRGTLAAMALLPAVAHSLELVVHAWRGTVVLGPSIAASIAFTALSTTFNLFAMRRGVLIVGDGGRSLCSDLSRLPRLIVDFLVAPAR
jgi:hypothetical protein